MVNKNVTKCNPKHIITCLQEITFSVQDCYQQSWLPVLAWVWMGGPHHWTGDLTGFSLPKVGNDTTTFLRQRPGQVHGKGPAQHLLQHFHKDLWYLLGKLCRNIAPVVSAGRTCRKISKPIINRDIRSFLVLYDELGDSQPTNNRKDLPQNLTKTWGEGHHLSHLCSLALRSEIQLLAFTPKLEAQAAVARW